MADENTPGEASLPWKPVWRIDGIASGSVVARRPQHITAADAVRRFKDLFKDCTEIYLQGQFAWQTVLTTYARKGRPFDVLAYYDGCNRLLRANQHARIRELARNLQYDDASLKLLRKHSEDKCGPFLDVVATFVTSMGGLQKAFDPSSRFVDQNRVYRSVERLKAPWYELIRYDYKELGKHQWYAKRALDGGHMLRAGVASGSEWDKRPNPDHYLLILGYDGDNFVFWDPDSQVSNRTPFGASFGTLTYTCPSNAEAYHRLGTARDDTELACVDEYWGLFESAGVSAPFKGWEHRNKRYQVLSLRNR